MNMHRHATANSTVPNGGARVLDGTVSRYLDALDRTFLDWAVSRGATPLHVPATLPVETLKRIDYFASFPHQVSFPVAADAPAQSALAEGRDPRTLRFALPACGCVLNPAACYHVYPHLEGAALDGARLFTTAAPCFRQEAHYEPGARQWSFTMREIVCIGSAGEVDAFLDEMRTVLGAWLAEHGIEAAFAPATDPFFDPRSGKRLVQQLDGLKTELVEPGGVAIASLNCHQEFFGKAFAITRQGVNGATPATSGCVAFGLERWMLALERQFGADVARWPAVGSES
jgi:hypothetical protein